MGYSFIFYKKMVNKEKIFIGLLILVIILSIGSIMIMNNIDSDDVSEKINYEGEQSSNINLGILETEKNSGEGK